MTELQPSSVPHVRLVVGDGEANDETKARVAMSGLPCAHNYLVPKGSADQFALDVLGLASGGQTPWKLHPDFHVYAAEVEASPYGDLHEIATVYWRFRMPNFPRHAPADIRAN